MIGMPSSPVDHALAVRVSLANSASVWIGLKVGRRGERMAAPTYCISRLNM
jgi:hypothetical protein